MTETPAPSDAPSAASDPVPIADDAPNDPLHDASETASPPEELSAPDEERIVADPNERASRKALPFIAFALALASLFGMLATSGIWDPPELKVADLSRRIAVALFHAQNLVIGADNVVPTAPELGRGELPFTSIALGLKVFGLNEWAGRLPMALWGFAGVLATFWFLSRLVDRVAASFAVVALVTMPLFFLQSRTILGDIVAMSGIAIAVAGLAVAVFDTRLASGARYGAWLLGAGGMAAGYGARGVLVGVALPALTVALSWLVRRNGTGVNGLSAIFAVLCLVLGLAGLGLGVRALVVAEDRQFVRLLGAVVERKRLALTHDVIVHQLGHALFPWSAFIPFALGRLFRPPIAEGEAFERESDARVVVLMAATLSFGLYTALAPLVGVLPFGGVFALACAVALCLRDFERGAPPSRGVAIGVAALLVLFYTDFKNFPEKGLTAFVVDDVRMPDSFKDTAKRIMELGALASAGLFALSFFERDEGQRAFDKPDYLVWPTILRTTWGGNIGFAAVGLEAAFVVLARLSPASDRVFHLPFIETMALPLRLVSRFGFVVLPVILLLPFFGLLARDALRFGLRKLRVTRGTSALVSIAALGAVLSFVYYPALARQISPKEVFESYQKLARPGEELGMIATSNANTGTARYYAHGDVKPFTNVTDAFNWLTASDDKRRFLISRSNDIGQINSQFRAARRPAKNIPVLDARSSEILLVSNRLLPGETNENPFAKWVLEERPTPQRPIDIDFNGQLHAFGWAITNADGEPLTWVRAGKPYEIRFYYEVTRPISGEWQTFIHIDGYQRRYNGDHDTLEGKYPFHLWKTGDVMVDIHPFELEPNFTAGTYTVFFGLFRGDQRLEVKTPGSQENRVNAGPLEVR
jgi:4-amino-4-deoxy-L-arabinose transferase-like glycosyltransferase